MRQFPSPDTAEFFARRDIDIIKATGASYEVAEIDLKRIEYDKQKKS